jgi:hypothetical protein
MAIEQIPGVGPQNSDIATAVAAAVPTAAAITSTVQTYAASAGVTNTNIANSVAAAVPSAANIQNIVTTYGNAYNGPSAATIASTVAAANNTNVQNIVQTYASAKSWRGQKFTASGNWTAPTGVNYAKVLLVGAGGGFGSGTGGGIGGGGGGQVFYEIIAVSPGTNYAITIGAGANAASGNPSTFGNILTAGGGGTGGASATNAGNGNAGTNNLLLALVVLVAAEVAAILVLVAVVVVVLEVLEVLVLLLGKAVPQDLLAVKVVLDYMDLVQVDTEILTLETMVGLL